MRIVLVLAAALLVAACARQSTVQAPAATPVPALKPDRAGLVGLNPTEIMHKLGRPALQVREGNSLKLQFRNALCVIDAYLYPGQNGALRVEHVDTRAPSGVKSNEERCVAMFQAAAS